MQMEIIIFGKFRIHLCFLPTDQNSHAKKVEEKKKTHTRIEEMMIMMMMMMMMNPSINK
jgi:hypothetical protein